MKDFLKRKFNSVDSIDIVSKCNKTYTLDLGFDLKIQNFNDIIIPSHQIDKIVVFVKGGITVLPRFFGKTQCPNP